MRANQATYPVTAMCRVLEVSGSGFYAWLKRSPSERAKEDDRLREQIREVHRDSRGTYGAPRIVAELLKRGVRISQRRVARLMREAGIQGVSRRRGVRTTRSDGTRPQKDLVERCFKAEKANQLWVADITYIPTLAGFLYLAVILDVWSRRIVGWSMRRDMTAVLAVEALDMAVANRGLSGVVHHSDRGVQYTCEAFGERCRLYGVTRSMGSVGDCYDNAMAESFFATLECELIDRTRFLNQDEAAREVFDYIEGFYNTRRLHSAIGMRSPAEYENTIVDAALATRFRRTTVMASSRN